MLEDFGRHVEGGAAEGVGERGRVEVAGEPEIGDFEVEFGGVLLCLFIVGVVAVGFAWVVDFFGWQWSGQEQVLRFNVPMN